MTTRPTHLNSSAPTGWTNIVPASSTFATDITTATGLIKAATATSTANDDITTPYQQGAYATNIQLLRTALWLRSDSKISLSFHGLDGPTKDHPERCPKYCVCAGITKDLFDHLPNPVPPSDATYSSIQAAVIYFAKNNQAKARLFLFVNPKKPLDPADWIYPIFQCARSNDLAPAEGSTAPEPFAGMPEDYTNQATLFVKARWTGNLTTWKLRKA